MGLEIQRDSFDDDDFVVFGERLQDNLRALDAVLARPGFGNGAVSIGAEMEMSVVRPDGEPALINESLLAALGDPQYTAEINRFNLEYNARPRLIAGAPFSALAQELEGALARIAALAEEQDACPAIVGILPTLAEAHLGPTVMTPLTRYRVLNEALRRLRGRPFRINIDGAEPLRCSADDVTYEGANTSLQVHLRVPPARFDACFNAAQMATAPVIAVCANSPFFVHHRLWEETRIVVFKQSVDDRAERSADGSRLPRVGFGHAWLSGGVGEYFRQLVDAHAAIVPICGEEDATSVLASGGTPRLEELRLHNSTVWTWNRPIYDPADGGHLRIEYRSLPAGPTVVDMAANAALILGLTLGLAERGPPVEAFPFAEAHNNFYRAAQGGLSAVLGWPDGRGGIDRVTAWELLGELLPVAAAGLKSAGVDRTEIARQLALIEARLETAATGARWQHQTVARLERNRSRAEALAQMMRSYMNHSRSGQAVHLWPQA